MTTPSGGVLWEYMKKDYGFTIVELLVVIVVVGILAAISVVAYNSVQQRANNAAIISAASNTIKLVQAYMASEGDYPVPTNATLVFCVTTSTGCHDYASSHGSSAAFDANITVVGQPPRSVPGSGETHYGILGTHWRGNAFLIENGGFYITYYLQGVQQQCGLGPVLNSSVAAYVTNGYTTGNTNSTGKTLCHVHVPKPV